MSVKIELQTKQLIHITPGRNQEVFKSALHDYYLAIGIKIWHEFCVSATLNDYVVVKELSLPFAGI